MAKVDIIIDSTANADPAYLAQHSCLHMVSLKVGLGQRDWLEGQLQADDLFQLARTTGHKLWTSQPSTGDFLTILAPLVKLGHEVVIITMAGGLSGTVNGAESAARMVGGTIQIVDSATAAVGMVYLAQAGLAMAAKGADAAAIAAKLRRLAKITHTLFVPETLEYLYKGGRIGGAAALFGSILQIKPVLQLVDGKVVVVDKVRTRQRAIEQMLDKITIYHHVRRIGIVHACAYDEAQQLGVQAQQQHPNSAVTVSTIGAVLAAHLGPGVIGVIVQENDEEE